MLESACEEERVEVSEIGPFTSYKAIVLTEFAPNVGICMQPPNRWV